MQLSLPTAPTPPPSPPRQGKGKKGVKDTEALPVDEVKSVHVTSLSARTEPGRTSVTCEVGGGGDGGGGGDAGGAYLTKKAKQDSKARELEESRGRGRGAQRKLFHVANVALKDTNQGEGGGKMHGEVGGGVHFAPAQNFCAGAKLDVGAHVGDEGVAGPGGGAGGRARGGERGGREGTTLGNKDLQNDENDSFPDLSGDGLRRGERGDQESAIAANTENTVDAQNGEGVDNGVAEVHSTGERGAQEKVNAKKSTDR
jgi:hypothetical protein